MMDHYRHPRHRGVESEPHDWTILKNPACGDIARIALVVSEESGGILCLQRSEGCAVSVASSSILCCTIQNMSAEQALSWVRRVLAWIHASEECPNPEDLPMEIQSILAFSGVPARQVCAALSWRCAENALEALCDRN
jgi:nitrogen fixation protein NifU and related proteins